MKSCPNGPAAKAACKTGTLSCNSNGKAIADARRLSLEVASVLPVTKVPVGIWRDGAAKTVDVVVKDLPGQAQLAKDDSIPSDANDTLQGVAV